MNANIGLDAASKQILAQAAGGDLAAQRALAQAHIEVTKRARIEGGHSDLAAFEAVLWARLAAAHGEDADAMRLSMALLGCARELGERGETGVAHGLAGEGVAILRALTAGGYAPAGQAFEQSVSDLAPSIIQKSTTIIEEALNAQANPVRSLHAGR